MKKLLVLLLTAACALCLAFAFAGCTDENGGESSGGSNTQQGETGGSDNTDDSGSSGDTGSSDSGSEETGGEHVHNYGNLIPEKPATCTKEGLQAYYYCEGCQTYFDGDKNETTLDELKISVDSTAHNYGELIPEKPATCTKEGLQAHYYCSGCQTYFDGDKQEKTLDELKISVDPNAHNYGELIPQVMTNCENEGMQAYYHCEDCGKYFDDKKSEKSFNDLIIPAGHHILEENQVVCKACNEQLAESLTFELNSDNTYELTSGTPTSDGKIIIPKIYNNLPVTSIGDRAFYNCKSLESITIPDSVTSIGSRAFSGCTSLTSITIPNSVTSIGIQAFQNCESLESITIPDSVTSIDHYAFNSCTAEIKWGDNPTIKEIGNDAFSGYKGTSITIPDSVTSIGKYAFSGCTNLESITVSDRNTAYASQDGILYNKDKTKFIHIPQAIKGSITIPNGVTSIGNGAFSGCTGLTSITIPDSVTSIGNGAFYSCESLESITVSDNNTAYASQDGILYNKAKTEFIHIPEAIKSAVTIPNGVTSIGEWAFSGCENLTSITIGNGVTSIGEHAFNYCTSLTSVTIGSGVTSIGDMAFLDCTSLTSITIPDSVTSIGYNAFLYCTSLENITVSEDNQNFSSQDGVLYNKDITGLICLPEAKTSIIIPDSVTSIGERAFEDCTGLTSLTIPDSVTSIDDYAFIGCTSLTSITIPDSVTSIGEGAFYHCTSLESITIPNSVTSIGSCTFYNCTSLTSVTIPNGITSIGEGAFSGCENLTSVIFVNPNGWYVTNDSSAISGTDIQSDDLQKPETAAQYLRSTYMDYYWKRKTT